ncbi:MAG TPA: phosphonate degradation HD-domain oxygenase [Chitinophagaceae bacterium]|jgi:phosphonate degradation associated HDIG domain protein
MQTQTQNSETITTEIMSLFEKYGDEDYDGEPVSQASHMIQCATLAMNKGEDTELVLGAFLHDIGHLLKHKQQTEAMGSYGVVNHEGIGAGYLRTKGFSDRICAVVEKHVDAKRYLVSTKPGYKEKLSEASLKTLEYQGGPMNTEEVALFKQQPFFDDIIKVRLWDEQAKDTKAVTLPLDHFAQLIREYLNSKN